MGTHEMEEIDLREKLQKVIGDLELQVEEKAALINIGPMPVIKGYRRQIQQLFQNLIGNALKYHRPGEPPVINISSRALTLPDATLNIPQENLSGQYHLIEVSDNGIGFEQEQAERIFQIFTRLHGNKEFKGTGVGLSIARKVVENHGGYIWAESAAGKGASFKVLHPV
jgi:signal transduction histidine kinase